MKNIQSLKCICRFFCPLLSRRYHSFLRHCESLEIILGKGLQSFANLYGSIYILCLLFSMSHQFFLRHCEPMVIMHSKIRKSFWINLMMLNIRRKNIQWLALNHERFIRHYSNYPTIFDFFIANHWSKFASWVPNPHIALFLIRNSVIYFSQWRPAEF